MPSVVHCSTDAHLRSFGAIQIKGTEESTLGKDSSVPLMCHDLSDLRSLILVWIIPKERTLCQQEVME